MLNSWKEDFFCARIVCVTCFLQQTAGLILFYHRILPTALDVYQLIGYRRFTSMRKSFPLWSRISDFQTCFYVIPIRRNSFYVLCARPHVTEQKKITDNNFTVIRIKVANWNNCGAHEFTRWWWVGINHIHPPHISVIIFSRRTEGAIVGGRFL